MAMDSAHASAHTAVSSVGVATYALAHCAVDASCIGLLWTAHTAGSINGSTAWAAFFAYNFLAFALQPLVGLAVDRTQLARAAAILGGGMVALAWVVFAVPGAFFAALLVAGLGNAVFHVGGGVVSLTSATGFATPVAVFVAPGAAGVLAGTLLGRGGGPAWLAAAALASLTLMLAWLPAPRFFATRAPCTRVPAGVPSALGSIVLLLLFVVAVRSYAGMALVFPWKSEPALLALLTAAVVVGKAVGGVAADRLGWRTAGVGALLVSIPLLALGADLAAVGIVGALVFNMTMPVTLVALAGALRGNEGFAFGLTCLALFAGAAPVLIGWTAPISLPLLLACGATATAALWLALGKLLQPGRPGVVAARQIPKGELS